MVYFWLGRGARLAACSFLAAVLAAAQAPAGGWPAYGHDNAGTRFSPLTQISAANVARLKAAWIYHTGDIADGNQGGSRSGFEATPIVAGGTMYLCTGFDRVVALDPATGRPKWTYDPHVNLRTYYGDGLICRGVAAWP
ncbi:MAG: hypothetical protein ACRD2H_11575, partial [Terriglobales bacterium]